MATLSQIITPSNILTASNTATLTNKTLTAPIISGSVLTASGNLTLNPATNIVVVEGNGSNVRGALILNCEINTHGQTIVPQLHSAGVTNTLTLPAGGNQELTGTTATQTLTNKTVTDLIFDGKYTEEVFTITDGASVDIDPANGTVQVWTIGASRSPTATNFASGQSVTLLIDDGTAYAITWTGVEFKTDGGVAPTLNTTGFTVIQLWKVSTVLYGARVGDA